MRGRVFGPGWTALCIVLWGVPATVHGQQTVSLAAQAPGEWRSSAQVPAGPTAEPGVVHGTVSDARGEVITGAQVTLSSADGAAPQKAVSDEDGNFRFVGVRPGAFTIHVTFPGFDTGRVSGNLLPGQNFEVATFALKMSTVDTVVEAVMPPDVLATAQLHAEEHQRLVGVLPNFFVSYNWQAAPLTARQKFALSWKNVSDPGNLLLVGVTAGVQQADNAFPGYGQGGAGYGKRYGADLGNLVSGTFMGGAVLPALFRQDPRYFYKGTGSVKSRALYALSTAVICRGDNGHRQPAFASVLGDFSAGAISNLYYAPSDRQGATLTMENGFLGVAGDAMNNLFQEFVLKHFTTKAKVKAVDPLPANAGGTR